MITIKEPNPSTKKYSISKVEIDTSQLTLFGEAESIAHTEKVFHSHDRIMIIGGGSGTGITIQKRSDNSLTISGDLTLAANILENYKLISEAFSLLIKSHLPKPIKPMFSAI